MRNIIFIILLLPIMVLADSSIDVYVVEIIDHKFVPETIVIPSKKKIKLIIKNRDNEAEEFESFDLKREKIILPHGEVTVNINPLSSGEYKFFGEFHHKTAQGKIIVQERE